MPLVTKILAKGGETVDLTRVGGELLPLPDTRSKGEKGTVELVRESHLPRFPAVHAALADEVQQDIAHEELLATAGAAAAHHVQCEHRIQGNVDPHERAHIAAIAEQRPHREHIQRQGQKAHQQARSGAKQLLNCRFVLICAVFALMIVHVWLPSLCAAARRPLFFYYSFGCCVAHSSPLTFCAAAQPKLTLLISLCLQFEQRRVLPAQGEQFLVTALLHDLRFF